MGIEFLSWISESSNVYLLALCVRHVGRSLLYLNRDFRIYVNCFVIGHGFNALGVALSKV